MTKRTTIKSINEAIKSYGYKAFFNRAHGYIYFEPIFPANPEVQSMFCVNRLSDVTVDEVVAHVAYGDC